MIISCPSCATRYNLPDGHIAADGTVIRCAGCGHSWVESTAVELLEIGYDGDDGFAGEDGTDIDIDIDNEAERIARAAREAADAARQLKRLKRKKQRGWGLLAASVAAPLAAAIAFPDAVVSAAPAATRLYALAGMDVRLNQFEIRNITQQHLRTEDARVLAIRGEVANTGGDERRAPGLTFRLLDGAGNEVYSWSLNSTAVRTLSGGGTTSFVTRVADPPETAEKIEIGFANGGGIGSSARP